ncbi:hypothetical protein CAXC1_330085 [Candidatus Xenohaliotis californiensis]|uniref:Uncharacterized protein n=1 Tax=Candidatus Xenohaliotis californiensis TaxID=84677 RepID=A0ABM9N8W7_9RICK|nr:hypothetical protein CAXC1_330085 [Candidatus Xenohaliotis californiensis]
MDSKIRKNFLTVVLNGFPLNDAIDFFYSIFIDETNAINRSHPSDEQPVAWQVQEIQRGYKYDTIIITNLEEEAAKKMLKPILDAIKKSRCNQEKNGSPIKTMIQKSTFNDKYELLITTTHGKPALSTAFCAQFIKNKYPWHYYKHRLIQSIKTIAFVFSSIIMLLTPVITAMVCILLTSNFPAAVIMTSSSLLLATSFIGGLFMLLSMNDIIKQHFLYPYTQGIDAAYVMQDLKKEIRKSLEETISTNSNPEPSLIYKISEDKDIEDILTKSPKHKLALLHHITKKIIDYKINLLIKLSSKELLAIIKQQDSPTFSGLNEAESRSLLQKLLNNITEDVVREQVGLYFENIDYITLSSMEVRTILKSAIHSIDPEELLLDGVINSSIDVMTLKNTLCTIVTGDSQISRNGNLLTDNTVNEGEKQVEDTPNTNVSKADIASITMESNALPALAT